jgi:hypothetical protein
LQQSPAATGVFDFMADIFISYWNGEYGVASAVQDFIHAQLESVSIFMADSRTLRAGDDWLTTIRTELKEARVVLSILSDESVKRPWVHFEAGAAWMDKVLIPVCFGRMEKGSMPAPYNRLQAIQLRLPADQYQLIRDLDYHLGLNAAPEPHHFALAMVGNDEHPLRKVHRNFTELIESWERE